MQLISDWKSSRGLIETMCSQEKGHYERSRKLGDSTILSGGAEEYIAMWISSLRRDGCPVSAQMLHFKAREVAADQGIPPALFSPSHSWRRRFMRRNRLSIRAKIRQGQTTPEDAHLVVKAFKEEVKKLILKHNITIVLNADQTAVFYEYLPTKTINAKGEATIWIKCAGKDKETATMVLLADWHGNKYPPFIIFKSKDSRDKARQHNNEKIYLRLPASGRSVESSVQEQVAQVLGRSTSATSRRSPCAGSRAAQRLGITARTDTALRLEMRDVARDRVADIQREAPNSIFRVTPPDREGIVSWVCSSWETSDSDVDISELVEKLKKLGVVGESVREEQDLTCDEDADLTCDDEED